VTDERNRAISAETRLEGLINNEVTRSTNEDTRLNGLITNEITRSTDRDNSLEAMIDTEGNRAKAAESALTININNEATRAQNAESALSGQITTLSGNSISAVTDSTTLNLEVLTSKTISGEVLVANADTNIITKSASVGSGLYAAVDLDYNAATNTLTLKTSNINTSGTTKNIVLNMGSVVESISYDPITKELVIEYKNQEGEPESTRVPVTDLFNEWKVAEDSDAEHHVGAITLTKTLDESGTTLDELSASVNISSADNNILRNANGNLTVNVSTSSSNVIEIVGNNKELYLSNVWDCGEYEGDTVNIDYSN
jgi:hypothetical protein